MDDNPTCNAVYFKLSINFEVRQTVTSLWRSGGESELEYIFYLAII